MIGNRLWILGLGTYWSAQARGKLAMQNMQVCMETDVSAFLSVTAGFGEAVIYMAWDVLMGVWDGVESSGLALLCVLVGGRGCARYCSDDSRYVATRLGLICPETKSNGIREHSCGTATNGSHVMSK
jgi:hypothetical protein